VPPLPLPRLIARHDGRPPAPEELEELRRNEAMALFLHRARAVRPDFALTPENAEAVLEIVRRLDGLPLALELAAARTKILSPPALLARLENRLQVLTGGPRDLPARLQTMRDAIAWSHDLLPPEEQLLFRQLSVFVGGFTLDAADWVTGDGSQVTVGSDALQSPTPITHHPSPITLDAIAALVDRSLLIQIGSEGGATEALDEPRFAMLETIREFGIEQLSGRPEEEATRRAHARFYLELAARATPGLLGPEPAQWLDTLEREHGNLGAALSWSVERPEERETFLRLATALWWFWRLRGHLREGRDWLERAVALSTPPVNGEPSVAPPLRAAALDGAGDIAWSLGDYERAASLHQESLTISRALADKAGMARALFGLGDVGRRLGDPAAGDHFAEALALFTELGDRAWAAFAMNNLGVVALFQARDHERAAACFEEALRLANAVGFRWGIAVTLYHAAELHRAKGDFVAAARRIEWGRAGRPPLRRRRGLAGDAGHPAPGDRRSPL
jgi:predicted ATPase